MPGPAQDAFHGLLWPPVKCFCWALMSVRTPPPPDCQLLEGGDRVCLVYLLASWEEHRSGISGGRA